MMLDRFTYDGAEPATVAACAYCGGEIRAGDEVRALAGERRYVHAEWGRLNCAEKYALERVFDGHGVINERGEIE